MKLTVGLRSPQIHIANGTLEESNRTYSRTSPAATKELMRAGTSKAKPSLGH